MLPRTSAGAGIPYHDLVPDPFIVAVTPGLTGEPFARALDRLGAAGAEVPVALVGGGFILVDSPRARDAVATLPGVVEVLEAPGDGLGLAGSVEAPVGGLVRWWNEGFRVPEEPTPEREEAARQVQFCRGAETLEASMARRGFLLRCGAPSTGPVHFIQGRSIVNVILPDGPNASNWDGGKKEQVLAELARACNWWRLKTDMAAQFVIVDHGVVDIPVEPGTILPDDEQEYLEPCMAALGYPTTTCAYDAVQDLNSEFRVLYGGNWSWSQFVLNANSFPGSNALAYAYLGGPLTVGLYGNGSLSVDELDRVMAHEMGHIFQAHDEYAGGCGCGTRQGYVGAPNNNCVTCTSGTTRCMMRSASAYSLDEMHHMEDAIEPCHFTRGAVGLWDSDGDGTPDVRQTRPETLLSTVMPDTLYGSENFPVEGSTWDVPYDAPPQFGPPVTINRIIAAEYSVDNAVWRNSGATDGSFTGQEESFVFHLPRLGGGPHRVKARGVNTVGRVDVTPAVLEFFVYDVRLARELTIYEEDSRFGLDWQLDGIDFGATYRILRREVGSDVETLLLEEPSRGGRNDRHLVWDDSVVAGQEYIYRLFADVPGLGVREMGLVRGEAVLARPKPGSLVVVAPNPARDNILFTVSVPWGPRPSAGDILPPPGSPSPRDGDDDPPPPVTGPVYRDAQMDVFDVQGRHLRDLGAERHRELERFNVAWDGRDGSGRRLPPGVYFLRVSFGYQESTEKVVLLR
jgi:hypothetical protein